MDNLGAPVAYLVLPAGAPVYDPSGAPVGQVAQVLADRVEDIFHGLIIAVPGTPDGYRFVDPDQIDALYERGVTLAVTADKLHEPSEDAVAAHAMGDPAHEGLRRAWEWVNRKL